MKLPKLPKEIEEQILPPKTFLCGFRGSIAHNTYVPSEDPSSIDDIDIMAVYVAHTNFYVGLGESDGYRNKKAYEKFINEWDSVAYEVRKFVSMLLGANPNVMPMLWMRPEFIFKTSPEAKLLIENRDIFLSQKIYSSLRGYAYGQFKRMFGSTNSGLGYMGAKRKKLVEKFGYDCKNAGHLIRLLRMCCETLENNTIHVSREHDAQELIDIKTGKWKLDEVTKEADKLFSKTDDLFKHTTLPEEPNKQRAEEILKEIITKNIDI